MPNSALPAPGLLGRTFRPDQPFRPRPSPLRRWGMMVLFLFLCSIIGSYWYITDSRRVTAMAEAYLQDLIGGHVKVGNATLSIFEGLKLERVSIAVDDSDAPDSVIFSARSFLLKYNPAALLRGRVEAERIVAIHPHVRLSENLDDGTWNYQRLEGRRGATTAPSLSMSRRPPAVLPEIILRSAQVDYSEVRGGDYRWLGSLAMEGRLTPAAQQRTYRFDLQSRGAIEGMGPVVGGTIDLATGQVAAHLRNFEFGRDIRSMLPAQVRHWWQRHELSGRVDISELVYQPSEQGYQFKVVMNLHGVRLAVYPREWMGREESQRWAALEGGLGLMRSLGMDGMIPELARRMSPAPIRLENVSGQFLFTEAGIEISGLTGWVESNGFAIDGRMDGYSPHAPFTLRVASQEKGINIPGSPAYVNSLPRQVREVYERLRPQGSGRLHVEVKRTDPGERPEVAGQIEIIDGQFVFDKFPYPLRRARGRIVVGRDEQTGADFLRIENLSGRGIEGGPNANSIITVNGLISPFGPESGVTVRVEGKDIHSEPPLRAAFPEEVNRALAIFGPPPGVELPPEVASVEYPRFHGDFTCDVIRPIGLRQRWMINTDLFIDDGSGSLKAFPYPLEGVSAKVKIRRNHLEIVDARMRQGDSILAVNGRVDWGDGRPVEPNVRVRATGVPIDARLLGALPPERRAWLEKIGLGGRLLVDGRVFLDPAPDASPPATQPSTGSALGYEFGLTLSEGTVWPVEGTFAISGLEGRLRLTPDRLQIDQLHATRGQGEIQAQGRVDWGQGRPELRLEASATDLLMDAPLYTMLPRAAQQGWEQIQPEGTLDVELNYHGVAGAVTGGGSSEASSPAMRESSPGSGASFEVVLRPRRLSATPRAMPYRLDELRGSVTVTPQRIVLDDIVGRHGPATIRIAGGRDNAPGAAWDLQLVGQDVPVDEAFLASLPPALGELIGSMKLSGRIGFDFAKLLYRPGAESQAAEPTTVANTTTTTTQSVIAGGDVDFATKLTFHDAAMDVGVALSQIQGAMELDGTIRAGSLAELKGQAAIDRMLTAGRRTENFRAALYKPADQQAMRIGDLHGQLAGGELAGQVDLSFPDDGASGYAANLVLRDADVNELAQDSGQPVEGRLSASLALEGKWSDPTSRRGRGDVLAAGKQMYRIPLILGLLQITNLSLPFNAPFTEAIVGYSLEGTRVNFEHISLRSAMMEMEGAGSLDFNTRRVNLTFTTDSPDWAKLPILNDLFEGAHQELFKIQVRGTIQDPKVTASPMGTFSTTVDEVLRGE